MNKFKLFKKLRNDVFFQFSITFGQKIKTQIKIESHLCEFNFKKFSHSPYFYSYILGNGIQTVENEIINIIISVAFRDDWILRVQHVSFKYNEKDCANCNSEHVSHKELDERGYFKFLL